MYMVRNKWSLHTAKPYSDRNHVIQIKMKPTIHRLIPALLWSGWSSEGLLGSLNSATKELELRSWDIYIASITTPPRSPKPLFRPVHPNKQSTLKVASQLWHKKQQTQGRAVATASTDHRCWRCPLGALCRFWGKTTQRYLLEKLASVWGELVLWEIKAVSQLLTLRFRWNRQKLGGIQGACCVAGEQQRRVRGETEKKVVLR